MTSTAGDGWARQQCCLVRSGAVAAHASDAQAGSHRGCVLCGRPLLGLERCTAGAGRCRRRRCSGGQGYFGVARQQQEPGAWQRLVWVGFEPHSGRAGGLNVPPRRCTAQIWPKEVNTTLSPGHIHRHYQQWRPSRTKGGGTKSAAQPMPPAAAGAAAAVLKWARAARPSQLPSHSCAQVGPSRP